MKVSGQTQTLSLVLITGIIIAMIGMAYAWGMPLIQKRTTITEYSTAENFILALDNKITDIANSGVGEATLDIPDGFVTVVGYDENDPNNNSVIFEFTTDQPMIINSSMVIIKTTSFGEVGTYGASEPRIITMTGEDAGTGHIIKIKLHYRELLSSTKGYKIALDPIKSTGTSSVKVSFDRNIVQSEAAANGGDLILTHIKLDVL